MLGTVNSDIYVLCMHVKLKDGKVHVWEVGKLKLIMQFSEDSEDEGHVKALRAKEVLLVPRSNPSTIISIS